MKVAIFKDEDGAYWATIETQGSEGTEQIPQYLGAYIEQMGNQMMAVKDKVMEMAVEKSVTYREEGMVQGAVTLRDLESIINKLFGEDEQS